MRNLKKFLALVLAMMMAFSLMVTVNAKDVTTDFSDSESVTESFQEGLQVLAGMKVFEGYEDGTFKPKNNITRAEVATIVYRIATGDAEGKQAHLYKDYVKFDDVKPDHWAAGYINYCANAEWIAGYGNGKFGPNDQVTGYQAAAMILRAVGYGKNNEFVGSGWQVQVANVTRSEGLLVNVDNTTYANTLNQVANRELVGEILFQAAQIDTVYWTMLQGYLIKGPSLGTQNYGLTWGHGIIIGNQETGASNTLWGTTRGTDSNNNATFIDNSKPVYNANATQTLALKMDTGLKDFGHNYKVWYDYRGATHTVYAAYDKVVKTKLVTTMGDDGISLAYNADPDGANTTYSSNDGGSLYQVVTHNNEFTTTGEAYFSNAFKSFAKDSKFDTTANSGWQSPVNLYVVVSNSASKNVDAVISLNVQSSKISQVENVAATKTITANYANGTDRGYGNPNEDLGPDFEGTNNANVVADADSGDSPITIKQSALTANSSTTLNDYVVINAIGNQQNAAAARQVSGYNVAKIVDTKVGQVSYYDTKTQVASFGMGYNALVTANWEPDYVMLTDGTKIEKSLLYYTVEQRNNGAANYTTAIPQTQTDDRATTADTYLSGTYKFYLDSDGKYIGAERVYGEKFIYGTYVDYSTEISTGAFNYYVTGVTLDGKIVTEQFTHYNSAKFTGDMMGMDVYYHDANNQDKANAVSGVGGLRYRGFVLNEFKNLTDGAYAAAVAAQTSPADLGVITTPYDAGNLNQDAVDLTPWSLSTTASATAGLTPITTRDTTVGAVHAYNRSTGEAVYLTENTKFLVVSGYGTSNLKVETFNGISELKGDSQQVAINTLALARPRALPADILWQDYAINQMAYTLSNYFYADDGVYAKQIDTIILPSFAIQRVGSTDAYFIGDNTAVLTDRNNAGYNKYNLYLNGEKQEVWLSGAAPTADTFGRITATSAQTSTGETVYTWTALPVAPSTLRDYGIINANNTGVSDALEYVAATRDATVARFGNPGLLYNVANAKVVNLIPAATGSYPNLKTVADLNDLSTTVEAGGSNHVQVFAVETAPRSNVISVIYVVDISA